MDKNSMVFVEYKITSGRNAGKVMSRLFYNVDSYTKWILANEVGTRSIEIISSKVMTNGQIVFQEARTL